MTYPRFLITWAVYNIYNGKSEQETIKGLLLFIIYSDAVSPSLTFAFSNAFSTASTRIVAVY